MICVTAAAAISLSTPVSFGYPWLSSCGCGKLCVVIIPSITPSSFICVKQDTSHQMRKKEPHEQYCSKKTQISSVRRKFHEIERSKLGAYFNQVICAPSWWYRSSHPPAQRTQHIDLLISTSIDVAFQTAFAGLKNSRRTRGVAHTRWEGGVLHPTRLQLKTDRH